MHVVVQRGFGVAQHSSMVVAKTAATMSTMKALKSGVHMLPDLSALLFLELIRAWRVLLVHVRASVRSGWLICWLHGEEISWSLYGFSRCVESECYRDQPISQTILMMIVCSYTEL
jgi:hypothetical protein